MSTLLKVISPVGSFIDWLADLIITDEYLERRDKEWKEAKAQDFYLS